MMKQTRRLRLYWHRLPDHPGEPTVWLCTLGDDCGRPIGHVCRREERRYDAVFIGWRQQFRSLTAAKVNVRRRAERLLEDLLEESVPWPRA